MHIRRATIAVASKKNAKKRSSQPVDFSQRLEGQKESFLWCPDSQTMTSIEVRDLKSRRPSQASYHTSKQQTSSPLLPDEDPLDRRESRTNGGGSRAPLQTQTEEWQTQFFKTKLCPYHLEGRCINGESCRFAHSSNEVRPLPDLHRTKLCESYVRKEQCRDLNCPFAHDPSELRTSSHSFYKVTLCNFYKKGRCWNGAHCRFAHGVAELQIAPVQQHPAQAKTPDFTKQHNTRTTSQQGGQINVNGLHLSQMVISSNGKKVSGIPANGMPSTSNISEWSPDDPVIDGHYDFANQLSCESSVSGHQSECSQNEALPKQPTLHYDPSNHFQVNSTHHQRQQFLASFMKDSHRSWQNSPSSSERDSYSIVPQLSQIVQKLQNNGCVNDTLYEQYPVTVMTERSSRPSLVHMQLRRRSVGDKTTEVLTGDIRDSNDGQEGRTPRSPIIYNSICQNNHLSGFTDSKTERSIDVSSAHMKLINRTPFHDSASNYTPVKLSETNTVNNNSQTAKRMLNGPSSMMLGLEQLELPTPHVQNFVNPPFPAQMGEVQSLTHALFSMLQQHPSGPTTTATLSSPASTSWSTPARASPMSIPNQCTDLISSHRDLSKAATIPAKIGVSDQWALELLKTLENIPTTSISANDENINSTLEQKPDESSTSYDNAGKPSCLSPSLQQQFAAFAAAAAAAAGSPKEDSRSNGLNGLFNLQALQGNGRQNHNVGLPWPSSLETLNGNGRSESLSVLPSLSSLVLSSFFKGPNEQEKNSNPSDENHTKQEAEKNEQQCEGINQATPSMFSLNLDKLVGFVTNDVANEEDHISLTNVSTGATTTAAHTPRRPSEAQESASGTPIRSTDENTKNTFDELSATTASGQQRLQAYHEIGPQSAKSGNLPWKNPLSSPLGIFFNNFEAASGHSKMSNFFSTRNSTEPTQSVTLLMTEQRRENSLPFPSPVGSNDGSSTEVSNNLQTLSVMDEASRHASSQFPHSFPRTERLEDTTPIGGILTASSSSPDSQWTPAPIGVPRRASVPRSSIKTEEERLHIHPASIRDVL